MDEVMDNSSRTDRISSNALCAPTRPNNRGAEATGGGQMAVPTSRAWRWRRRLRSSLTMRWSSTGRIRFPGLAAHSSISGTRSVLGLPSGDSVDCRPSGRTGLRFSVLYPQDDEAVACGRWPGRSLLLPRPRRSRRRAAATREEEAIAFAWGVCVCNFAGARGGAAGQVCLFVSFWASWVRQAQQEAQFAKITGPCLRISYT